MFDLIKKCCFIVFVLILVSSLYYLDQNRSGSISDLEKCSLVLSRAPLPAADVLVVGSSRVAVAVDPVAMQDMLSASEDGEAYSVDRLAIPSSPLRPSYALIENYFETRGAPKVLVYEIPLLTERTVKKIETRQGQENAESYLYKRDMNFMTFSQILNMPSTAMPFSYRDETLFDRVSLIAHGLVVRAGMLAFEFFHAPNRDWSLESCNDDDWRVGGMPWDKTFSFSYGHSRHDESAEQVLLRYQSILDQEGEDKELIDWQARDGISDRYAYDFDQSYRWGEMQYLNKVVKLAHTHGTHLIVMPLRLYDQPLLDADRIYLENMPDVHLFDLYSEAGDRLDKFWYNSAHVMIYPAGIYATALLGDYIIRNGMLSDD